MFTLHLSPLLWNLVQAALQKIRKAQEDAWVANYEDHDWHANSYIMEPERSAFTNTTLGVVYVEDDEEGELDSAKLESILVLPSIRSCS